MSDVCVLCALIVLRIVIAGVMMSLFTKRIAWIAWWLLVAVTVAVARLLLMAMSFGILDFYSYIIRNMCVCRFTEHTELVFDVLM